MKIKQPKKETYFKLMNYYLSQCDLLVLTQYGGSCLNANRKIQKLIFKDHPNYKKELLEKDNEKVIKKISDEYEGNKDIWNIIKKNNCFGNSFDDKEIENIDLIMQINISCALREYIYVSKFNHILNKYKKYLIEKKEVLYDARRRKEYLLLSGKDVRISHINYTFKLSSDMVKWVLETANSIDDFCSPNNPDELRLFKNEYCKMTIIGHEFECHLYIDDENEYEDLKKIKISFWKENIKIDEDKEWRSYDSMIHQKK